MNVNTISQWGHHGSKGQGRNVVKIDATEVFDPRNIHIK